MIRKIEVPIIKDKKKIPKNETTERVKACEGVTLICASVRNF